MGVLEIHEFCPKGHLSEGVMGLEAVEGKLTGKLIYAIGCEQCKKGYFRRSGDLAWSEDDGTNISEIKQLSMF